MSDKHFIGLDLTGLEDNGIQRPVSRVTLLLDDENAVTAGDDTGLEIVADCPHASRAMASAILSQVKGYQYRMFSADDAALDPAAELGDGVTAGGLYSVLSRLSDDGSGYSGIAAPGEAELEDEFPTTGPMTQEFNRKLGTIRSSIRKTAEEITLLVEDTANEISSEFSVKLDSITSTITGLDGKVSSIKQYVDNITMSVANGDTSSTITLKSGSAVISSQNITMKGLVTFAGLSSGTTTIDGACIKTGQISADRIDAGSLHVQKIYGSNFKMSVGESSSNTLCVGGDGRSWDYDTLRLFAHKEITLSSYNATATGVTVSLTNSTVTASTLWSIGTSAKPWGALHTGTHTIYSGATAGMTISSYQIYSTKTNYLGTSTYPWNYAYITTLYLNGTQFKPSDYAKTSDLNDYAKSSELSNYAKASSIYRLYAGGTNTSYYLTYNSSRQLIPSQTGSSYGSYIGSSSYPFYGGYFTGLTVQGGTLNLGTSAAKVGFFGATAQSRKSVSTVSTSATLSNVINGINNLINALKGYGLIA